MEKQNVNVILAGVLSTAAVSMAHSVEPEAIKLGDFEAKVLLESSLEHNDNIFRASSNEESSLVGRLSPVINLLNQTESRTFEINYRADAVQIFDFSDDSYVQQAGDFLASFVVAKEQTLGITAEYTVGREARGTGSSEGAFQASIDGVTEYNESDVGLFYEYGSEASPLSVMADVSFVDLEFQNFRAFTRQRDYEATAFNIEFDYKFSVASSFFVDLNVTEFDYSSGAPGFNDVELDNLQSSAHIGIAWSATRNTTGRVGFGVTKKDLDNFDNDESYASWDAAIDWLPGANDTVAIETARETRQPAGAGLFVVDTSFGVSWVHALSPYLSSDVYISDTSSDFEALDREDESFLYGISAIYEWNRSLEIELSYSYDERESTIDAFDLDQSIIKAGVNLAL